MRVYVTGDDTQSINPIFRFEPQADDNEGRVRYSSGASEILSLTVEASIEHIERLSFITAMTQCKTQAGDYKLHSAIEKGYIIAPESFTSDETETSIYNVVNNIEISDYFKKVDDGDNANKLTFTYEIAFQWGSFFNFKNPCKYYDEDNLDLPTGSDTDPAGQTTVSAVLKDLRTLLNGIELNLYLTAK